MTQEEHHEEHHIVPTRTYLVVYAALMVLLVLTVAAGYIDLGQFNLPLAMLIATVKAVLILLIFMHLRYSQGLVWAFSLAGFLWLAILFGLTFNDYLTRGWLEVPNR